MIIDAHFHIWRLARGDYSWLDLSANPALATIYQDMHVADWRAQSAPSRVVGGVLVQATPTAGETEFLISEAEASTAVLGVIGWVDWFAPDVRTRIEALARRDKLKGLRLMAPGAVDGAWLLQPALKPALEAMTACRLVLDVLIESQHLPDLLTLALRHPDLQMCVNHAAASDMAHDRWQPWADDLARFAATTQASCKLSGLMTEATATHTLEDMRRYGAHTLACFGANRVVWGSDWPLLELAGNYRQWWRETRTLLADFTREECADITGRNAIRLYRLQPAGDVDSGFTHSNYSHSLGATIF